MAGQAIARRLVSQVDIGKLSVCGTLNDLAVCGARPVAISCSLIIEEGFPLETLETILDSMKAAAEAKAASAPAPRGLLKIAAALRAAEREASDSEADRGCERGPGIEAPKTPSSPASAGRRPAK